MIGDGYTVVFDASQAYRPVWFPAVGLIFVAIGLLLWRFHNRIPGASRWPWRGHPWRVKAVAGFYAGFALLWTTISAVSVAQAYLSARRALRDGTAGVVEGPVLNFHPMPYSGHDTERFTVRGVSFEYSDYSVSAGFNHTRSHGGPIDEGVFVRIHYDGPPKGARILKLEIRAPFRHPLSTPARRSAP